MTIKPNKIKRNPNLFFRGGSFSLQGGEGECNVFNDASELVATAYGINRDRAQWRADVLVDALNADARGKERLP